MAGLSRTSGCFGLCFCFAIVMLGVEVGLFSLCHLHLVVLPFDAELSFLYHFHLVILFLVLSYCFYRSDAAYDGGLPHPAR